MILPDANLLIYAYDKENPHHDKSARWWSDALSGSEPVVLCAPTIFAFIRLTTSPRLFREPFSIREVSTHVLAWLAQPNVQFVDLEIADVQQALELLGAAGTAGNLTSDAQIAALSLRLGANIYTNDTDFARFPLVRWLNPLHSKRHR